jgi:hypothetical protein
MPIGLGSRRTSSCSLLEVEDSSIHSRRPAEGNEFADAAVPQVQAAPSESPDDHRNRRARCVSDPQVSGDCRPVQSIQRGSDSVRAVAVDIGTSRRWVIRTLVDHAFWASRPRRLDNTSQISATSVKSASPAHRRFATVGFEVLAVHRLAASRLLVCGLEAACRRVLSHCEQDAVRPGLPDRRDLAEPRVTQRPNM